MKKKMGKDTRALSILTKMVLQQVNEKLVQLNPLFNTKSLFKKHYSVYDSVCGVILKS